MQPAAPIIKTLLFLSTEWRHALDDGDFFRFNHPVRRIQSSIAAKRFDFCRVGSHRKKWSAKRQRHTHLMESTSHQTFGLSQLLEVINCLRITISVPPVAVG